MDTTKIPSNNSADSPKKKFISFFLYTRSVRAPIVVIICIILLAIFRSVNLAASSGNVYLSAAVMQIVAILLPALIYLKLSESSLARETSHIGEAQTAKRSVLLTLTLLLAMIFGAILLRFFLFQIGVLQKGASEFSSYAPNVDKVGGFSSGIASALLVFALLPAIVEELLFRGILFGEYRPYGTPATVLITSLLFAMIHSNIAALPIYVFCGATLGLCRYLTKSLLFPMILHLLYNVFICLFDGAVWNILSNSKSSVLFVLFVGIIFFVALFFALLVAENILKSAADPTRRSFADAVTKTKKGEPSSPFLSVSFLICAALFITVALLV